MQKGDGTCGGHAALNGRTTPAPGSGAATRVCRPLWGTVGLWSPVAEPGVQLPCP